MSGVRWVVRAGGRGSDRAATLAPDRGAATWLATAVVLALLLGGLPASAVPPASGDPPARSARTAFAAASPEPVDRAIDASSVRVTARATLRSIPVDSFPVEATARATASPMGATAGETSGAIRPVAIASGAAGERDTETALVDPSGTTSLTPDAVTPSAQDLPGSLGLEGRYDVALRLAWSTRRVRLRTTVDVRNTTARPVSRLVFNTVVARLGSMRGLRVEVEGAPVPARVGGQTIRVPLPAPLAPGAGTSVTIVFRARLNSDTGGRRWLWSQAGGVVHLYRFVPWLSRRIPIGPSVHGEPFQTAVSPRVRLRAVSDRPLVWATTGRRIASDGSTETFLAHDVRDFNLAASPAYRTRRGKSADGLVDIIVHTRALDAGRLLRLARAELARYRDITGVRYPYPVYRVAESAAGLAMESPGLIWIPRQRGSFDHPFLVSHETAHQWFYALVGNDQATDAFADEGLVEYFSRRARLGLRQSRCATDRLDRSIHAYRAGCYYETVYVQGALFLDGLRRDFGRRAFRRAVRAYTRAHAFGMGGNRALLEAFRAEMGDRVLPRFKRRFPSLY